jgi:hypothetical protein
LFPTSSDAFQRNDNGAECTHQGKAVQRNDFLNECLPLVDGAGAAFLVMVDEPEVVCLLGAQDRLPTAQDNFLCGDGSGLYTRKPLEATCAY